LVFKSSTPTPATRELFEPLPLPEARAALGFQESYTAEEFEHIKVIMFGWH
jgi:hypothetical protein